MYEKTLGCSENQNGYFCLLLNNRETRLVFSDLGEGDGLPPQCLYVFWCIDLAMVLSHEIYNIENDVESSQRSCKINFTMMP